MTSTRIVRHIRAPRAAVYRALLDPAAVERWRVPHGMRAEVHAFDAREGGRARVSLTYDAPSGAGKTTPETDTYTSRFVTLEENEKVVEAVTFETDDPALHGEMTIVISLADEADGTRLAAEHTGLPAGVDPADNETGWRQSLDRLAALLETGDRSRERNAKTTREDA